MSNITRSLSGGRSDRASRSTRRRRKRKRGLSAWITQESYKRLREWVHAARVRKKSNPGRLFGRLLFSTELGPLVAIIESYDYIAMLVIDADVVYFPGPEQFTGFYDVGCVTELPDLSKVPGNRIYLSAEPGRMAWVGTDSGSRFILDQYITTEKIETSGTHIRETLPTIPNHAICINQHTWFDGITNVAPMAGTGSSARFALEHINVRVQPDLQIIDFTGSNGKMLRNDRSTLKVRKNSRQLNWLLPADIAAKTAKAVLRYKRTDINAQYYIWAASESDWLYISSSDVVFGFRLGDGKFPDWESLVEDSQIERVVTCKKSKLLTALEVAGKEQKRRGCEGIQITLGCNGIVIEQNENLIKNIVVGGRQIGPPDVPEIQYNTKEVDVQMAIKIIKSFPDDMISIAYAGSGSNIEHGLLFGSAAAWKLTRNKVKWDKQSGIGILMPISKKT